MHSSVALRTTACGFAVGIALENVMLTPSLEVLFGIVLASFFVFGALTNRVPLLLALFSLGACTGVARMWFTPELSANPYDEHIRFQAEIVREPELRVDQQRIVVRSPRLDGLMLVYTPLQPRYRAGDQLEIECIVRQPEPFETFAYDQWLRRYGIGSTCYRPNIERRGRQESWRSALYAAKQFTMNRLQHVLSSPEHTILQGAIFGVNSALPAPQEEAFRITGTIHLLVISGSNVVVLSSILLKVLQFAPLSRRSAVGVVIVVLVFYVFITGVQPPAVRAAVFGGVALVGTVFGRPGASLHLLILVAAMMLALNPLLLLYDAGFQLSFLATVGIIVFSEPLERMLRIIPEAFSLRAASAVTIAASITTMPIIAYSFQTVSLITLPANLVVAPLMTAIMLLGCIGVVVALAIPAALASWVLQPLYYIIHGTLALVEWFAQVPYAQLEITALPLWFVAALYGFVLLWAHGEVRNQHLW